MIESLQIYEPGYILGEDEYLFKFRFRDCCGFLTKLTQKGELPKSFKDWDKSIIYIYTETFKEGWKLFGWRYGKSQTWAKIMSTDGFILEIYLSSYLKIILNNTIINGVLQGEFKWYENTLIKK